MIRNAFMKNKVGGFTNSSYLPLVQKEARAYTFNIFRPISSCNCSYKIITNIIANKIKVILPNVISENQGGFVPSRQILDNIMIVQEALHASLLNKEKGTILKLYMANDFDGVNLTFLFDVLHKFGFSKGIIDIIKACTIGPWIAPLINGRPSDFFQISRGLKQGFPLSPFLYIIMVDSFRRNLEKCRQDHLLTSLTISLEVKGINHSLFLDDTLVMGGASCIIARRIKKYSIALWKPQEAF